MNSIFLSHCFVSCLSPDSFSAITAYLEGQLRKGFLASEDFDSQRCHRAVASLLKVDSEDISIINNTAQALSCIASGYPFNLGDEVIIFEQEYPSNVYPWLEQRRRGVVVRTIPAPLSFRERVSLHPLSVENILNFFSSRTRVVALSHVQFYDGFALELPRLAQECTRRNIDLIIDGAQSVGAQPLYPLDLQVAVVTFPAWKFLSGPVGVGAMYMSQKFRDKIHPVLVGPDMMKQGADYLDHSYNPHTDGRKFQYSTIPHALAHGLAAAIDAHASQGTLEECAQRIAVLLNVFLDEMKAHSSDKHSNGENFALRPVLFGQKQESTYFHPSSILSLETNDDAGNLARLLRREGIIVTARRNMLRIAPHRINTESQMRDVARVVRRAVTQGVS
jgi:cysteine desulfurase / selenocysteine lyase